MKSFFSCLFTKCRLLVMNLSKGFNLNMSDNFVVQSEFQDHFEMVAWFGGGKVDTVCIGSILCCLVFITLSLM